MRTLLTSTALLILASHKNQSTMKTFAIAAIALFCVFALATANYGYPGYGYGARQQSGGGLGGGFLALLGLLFLLPLLFGGGFGGSSSTGTGSTTIIYGNFTPPTNGKK